MKNMQNTTRFRIRKYLPFLIILAGTIFLIEYHEQKPEPLPPPSMRINPQEMRVPNDDRDFTLPDMAGNQFRVAELKGKVVLLNFFATWCAPCRDEMPSIEDVYQTYRDKGFTVLGISRDEDGNKALAPFVKEFALTFPIVLDPDLQAFKRYFVRGVPVTYVLDKQGRIAGMHIGPADWHSPQAQSLIEELLKESS